MMTRRLAAQFIRWQASATSWFALLALTGCHGAAIRDAFDAEGYRYPKSIVRGYVTAGDGSFQPSVESLCALHRKPEGCPEEEALRLFEDTLAWSFARAQCPSATAYVYGFMGFDGERRERLRLWLRCYGLGQVPDDPPHGCRLHEYARCGCDSAVRCFALEEIDRAWGDADAGYWTMTEDVNFVFSAGAWRFLEWPPPPPGLQIRAH
jgi:hypothetical protein